METINYPKRETEADIQAALLMRLRSIGFDAHAEIKAPHARFDIVVFKNKQAACIIECKDWSPGYIRNRKWQTGKNSKQINRYKLISGLPVFLCGCPQAINPLCEIIKDRLN